MIFCVEDDASIRDIELYTLRSTGFEARGFEDGGAFLAALETERPELVILDVMLPGMDGVELLRRMKATVHLADIPVIMATAKDAEYDKIQSLDETLRYDGNGVAGKSRPAPLPASISGKAVDSRWSDDGSGRTDSYRRRSAYFAHLQRI